MGNYVEVSLAVVIEVRNDNRSGLPLLSRLFFPDGFPGRSQTEFEPIRISKKPGQSVRG
jgi:hypothetical protein